MSGSNVAPKQSPADGSGVWRVLLASDDNSYLEQLARLCRADGMHVEVIANEEEQKDAASNRSIEAAKVCGAGCVTSLLNMVQRFATSDRLILSSKSNLGGYLLSSWGAFNQLMPTFTDLDAAVRWNALPRRYFCELPWGSRHGLCTTSQSTCDVPQNAQRTYCKGKAGAAKVGAAEAGGGGGKAKGKGAGASGRLRRGKL